MFKSLILFVLVPFLLFVIHPVSTYTCRDLNMRMVEMLKFGKSCPASSYIRLLHYGNWCGPDNSVPVKPTDNLDFCCLHHYRCGVTACYIKKIYLYFFSCRCNNKLESCYEWSGSMKPPLGVVCKSKV